MQISDQPWPFNTGVIIGDEYGNDVENTPMNEMRVVIPTRLVGANFEGTTIDSNFWQVSIANSATATQANAQVALDTAATAQNGGVVMYSNRRARYVSGVSNGWRAVVQLGDTGATNNKRRWGASWGATMPATPTMTGITDGAWYQVDGTEFSIVVMKGGSETKYTTFSVEAFTMNTASHTYEIYWTNSKLVFSIDGDMVHQVSATGATWSNTMNFHAYADNVNRNNLQASHVLNIRVMSIRRFGNLLTQPMYYYFASGTTAGINLKLGTGNLHGIVMNNTTNNSVITLSDSTSAATPSIFVHTAGATSTAAYSVDFKGLPFANGLRLTVSAANSSVTIIYE